jgi:hypothetical protein
MSRLERSRGLRLLCTFAAVAALVVILFPVCCYDVGRLMLTACAAPSTASRARIG